MRSPSDMLYIQLTVRHGKRLTVELFHVWMRIDVHVLWITNFLPTRVLPCWWIEIDYVLAHVHASSKAFLDMEEWLGGQYK